MNTENTAKVEVAAGDEPAITTAKVHGLEDRINKLSEEITQNANEGKAKFNKPLKSKKRKLTSRKNKLEKE